MTMTDETVVAPRPAKKKRKAVKRAKRSPAVTKPAAPKAPSEFAGMTSTDCAKACNVDGCIVSGKSYCGHPCKGGLQANDMGNQAALHRLKAARKVLGLAEMDKKFD